MLSLAVVLGLSAVGCKNAKQTLEQWARKNSLRNKNVQQAGANSPQVASAVTKPDCPLGSMLQVNPATGISSCVPKKVQDPNTVEKYFPNGKVKSRIVHRKNALKASYWYQNGQLKEEIHYMHSEKHGPFSQWYPNGNIAVKGEYRSSKEHGHFVYANQAGIKTEEGKYQRGKKVGVWKTYHAKGSVKSVSAWVRGIQHGSVKIYDESGALTQHGSYSQGKPSGRWIGYYPNGSLRFDGRYLDGLKHGSWVEYDPKGQVSARHYFKRGELSKKTTLAGTVQFKGGDTLGAAPPGTKPRVRGLAPRKQPRKKFSDDGWVDM